MLDHSHDQLADGQILVLHSDHGLLVKRLYDTTDGWQLTSDNLSPDWPPLPRPGDGEIIGEVMWMARNL